jgi:hypothetical protein
MVARRPSPASGDVRSRDVACRASVVLVRDFQAAVWRRNAGAIGRTGRRRVFLRWRTADDSVSSEGRHSSTRGSGNSPVLCRIAGHLSRDKRDRRTRARHTRIVDNLAVRRARWNGATPSGGTSDARTGHEGGAAASSSFENLHDLPRRTRRVALRSLEPGRVPCIDEISSPVVRSTARCHC